MAESTKLVVRSTDHGEVAHYGGFRQLLRVDFWFSCAYCSLTEVEAQGLRFTIDHYLAKSKRPDLERVYTNLMWCCDACNPLKGDFWPDEVLENRGFSLYRPDRDHAEDHFTISGTRVSGITPIGQLTVEALDLNREQLRRLRELRARLASSSIEVIAGVRALLAVPIDRLSPALRARYVELKRALSEEQKDATATLEELLEAWARSHLLDVDLEARARASGRRKYLKSLRALLPEEP